MYCETTPERPNFWDMPGWDIGACLAVGSCVPMYCRELAQLHSSLHAYLARAGYKLTAMTFAEEAGSHVAGPAQNGTLLSMFQGYQQWQTAMQEAEASLSGSPAL